MRKFRLFILTGFLLICCKIPSVAQQVNWTHFRGTNLDGISRDQNAPTIWNDSVNIIWKSKINGKGWSSPVVYGDQVWISTASEDGNQMFGIRKLEIISRNKLKGEVFATPAIVNNSIIIRAGTNLYCIGVH